MLPDQFEVTVNVSCDQADASIDNVYRKHISSRINGLEVDSSRSRRRLEQVEHQKEEGRTGRLAALVEGIGFVVDKTYLVRPPLVRSRP